MPDPLALALFVGAALLLLVVPGPSVLYIVTQSVSHGRRAGIVSVAGITTGTLVHIAAATVGLSALLASSALAFDVVKYLGAAYLIAVGIRRLAGWERRAGPRRARPATSAGSTARGSSSTRSTRRRRSSSSPSCRSSSTLAAARPWLQILALGLLFAALGFFSDGAWALVAGTLGERLRRSRRFPPVQRYVSGSVFVGLGAVAALTAPVKQN